ncbi:hypothetical protein BJY00DRAFT_296001 [Aspergillus carlsbadensis]|nr:hypothetical protein BJY00DRAFT_296001 [Aspergillus carlsbadensis]
METREEKLASWADPSLSSQRGLRVLKGALHLHPDESGNCVRFSEERIDFNQIEDRLLNSSAQLENIPTTPDPTNANPALWHVHAISLPRIRPGRLVLSIPKLLFQKIQAAWNLHPRTIEAFLSNNGVLAAFESPAGAGRTSLIMKVANSRTTGFDCVSVTCDPARRTTYVLYHHLFDEDAVLATLLAARDERCVDPHFLVAAVYRAHHAHIEAYRNAIDDTVQGIERQTGFGNPGRLNDGSGPRPSFDMDRYPGLDDPKVIIQQLGYCQTDIAIIGHVARCCLDCGEWLIQAIDGRIRDDTEKKTAWNESEKNQNNTTNTTGTGSSDIDRFEKLDRLFAERLRAARLLVRQEVEYMRRRTVMLLSQVQQMSDRTQSQTSYMLSVITQSDAEYTADIAIDGKRDSIAMRTISILGIVYLPGTFVATLFSMEMFTWGGGSSSGGEQQQSSSSTISASPSFWIYWVIAVPLTVITLVIWIVWSRRENRRSRRRLMISRTRASSGAESKASVVRIEEVVLGENEKMV